MTPYIFIRKTLNKFGFIAVILFVFSFIWPAIAFTQQIEADRNQLITLPGKTIRLDSLSNLLSRKTGFVLSFNAGKINPGTKIIFPGPSIELSRLLLYLRQHYSLTHKMIGNHIILYNEPPSGRKVRVHAKIHGDRLSNEKSAVPNRQKMEEILLKREIRASHQINLPNTESEDSLKKTSTSLSEAILESPIERNYNLKIKAVKTVSYPERKFIRFSDASHAIANRSNINNFRFGKKHNHFYASAGLTASDVLYLNPQIKVGLPWLFGIASWETDFKTSGFFYGLGTLMRLSDRWNIQLSATNGTLHKDFSNLTFTGDTIGRTKTNLTRLDFLAEKHLAKRWTLQFGPTVNFMRSKYFLTDPSLVNFFPRLGMNENMDILSPLYPLNNSYNEKTGVGKKMWVGLQIGLFYTLW